MCEFQNYLMLPNLLCRATSIKARRLKTPLKFLKQVLAYITRHSEFYVPCFVPRIRYYCDLCPALTYLFYSVRINQLSVKHLYVKCV